MKLLKFLCGFRGATLREFLLLLNAMFICILIFAAIDTAREILVIEDVSGEVTGYHKPPKGLGNSTEYCYIQVDGQAYYPREWSRDGVILDYVSNPLLYNLEIGDHVNLTMRKGINGPPPSDRIAQGFAGIMGWMFAFGAGGTAFNIGRAHAPIKPKGPYQGDISEA